MKKISDYRTKLFFLVPTILLGVLLDQITKLIVRNNIPYGNMKVMIDDFFYLTYVTNKGGAWSIFDGNVIMLGIISAVTVTVMTYVIFKKNFSGLFILSASLIISGGFGNLIDRFFLGEVTDFLGFYIFGYGFPIFNVADILVVSGAIGFILVSIIDEYYIKKNKQNEEISVESAEVEPNVDE